MAVDPGSKIDYGKPDGVSPNTSNQGVEQTIAHGKPINRATRDGVPFRATNGATVASSGRPEYARHG